MSRRQGNKLPNNYPQLQNLTKRDPESYKDEFLQQKRHFESQLSVFELNPSEYSQSLDQITTFLAQVSHCYPEELKNLPQEISSLLKRHATILDPTLRMSFCKALILLRNKGLVSATSILELFFEMFRCPDKLLRKTLYNYIVADIKNVNAGHKDSKLNTTLQNFMFSMLRDSNSMAAKMSLDVMIELYKRDVWNDEKTVNVISIACFSKISKILMAALNFFLGVDKAEDESDDDDEEKSAKQLHVAHRVGKKSRKRKRHLERALTNLKKVKKKQKPVVFNFSAIHLIHDPQDFAERLFRQLSLTNERFEVKMTMINVISRLVGIHQLVLFNLYPYLQRFLQPHQRDVTKLLLYTAQACHDLVPPEIVEGIVTTIAHNFVTDRNSGEVIAVGLNAIREICARCPLSMTEELINDLVQYRSYKNKAVIIAAKSLIHVFRELHHTVLEKRYRGPMSDVMVEQNQKVFGDTAARDYVAGAEIIAIKSSKKSAFNDEISDKPIYDGLLDGEKMIDDDGNYSQSFLAMKLPVEERTNLARSVTSSRILTQEDFEIIRQRRALMSTQNAAKKRKMVELEDSDEETGDILPLSKIEMVHKKPDRESRLAASQTSKDEKEKVAQGHIKLNPNASTSNKDKLKKKTFGMIKHKVRQKKTKMSFREKQRNLKARLLKHLKSRH